MPGGSGSRGAACGARAHHPGPARCVSEAAVLTDRPRCPRPDCAPGRRARTARAEAVRDEAARLPPSRGLGGARRAVRPHPHPHPADRESQAPSDRSAAQLAPIASAAALRLATRRRAAPRSATVARAAGLSDLSGGAAARRSRPDPPGAGPRAAAREGEVATHSGRLRGDPRSPAGAPGGGEIVGAARPRASPNRREFLGRATAHDRTVGPWS